MDTYEECLCCQEIAPISEKKTLKCITEYDGFWCNYFNIDVQEISMYELVDRQDPLMTMNQFMDHDCTCKMQIKPRHYLVC